MLKTAEAQRHPTLVSPVLSGTRLPWGETGRCAPESTRFGLLENLVRGVSVVVVMVQLRGTRPALYRVILPTRARTRDSAADQENAAESDALTCS